MRQSKVILSYICARTRFARTVEMFSRSRLFALVFLSIFKEATSTACDSCLQCMAIYSPLFLSSISRLVNRNRMKLLTDTSIKAFLFAFDAWPTAATVTNFLGQSGTKTNCTSKFFLESILIHCCPTGFLFSSVLHLEHFVSCFVLFHFYLDLKKSCTDKRIT